MHFTGFMHIVQLMSFTDFTELSGAVVCYSVLLAAAVYW